MSPTVTVGTGGGRNKVQARWMLSPTPLSDLAANQKGHIRRDQLTELGLTRRQIQGLRRKGWQEVLPGVFKAPGAPASYEGRLAAAQLWMGNRGHFVEATAACILKLEGIERPALIQVAMPRGSACGTLDVRRLRAGDRGRSIDGLRVPFIEPLLLSLAACLPPRVVGEALDDALRRRMTTIGRLKAWTEEHGRRRHGSTTLRELIRGRDALDERTRSRFETEMLRILHRIEGVRVEPNHPIVVDAHRHVIDFFLVEPMLGIECHSVKWHGDERVKSDVVRDRRIRSTGVELLYFGWDEVHFDPRGTEREIRAAIERRMWSRWADRGSSSQVVRH